jgi:hypothetical protein
MSDDLSNLRDEFKEAIREKDEAYSREFKRINSNLSDIRSEFQSGLSEVFTRLDRNANNNRITLPVVLSVVGTILSVSVIAGVIHSQSLQPLYTQDKDLRADVTAIEGQLQHEVNTGHNPHALSQRIDYLEKHMTTGGCDACGK